jgi:hypothetical protein
MTAEPGGDGLVAHEFGVLVTRPRQRHHEEPGLEDFACVHIGDGRTSAEVDLHRLARLERMPAAYQLPICVHHGSNVKIQVLGSGSLRASAYVRTASSGSKVADASQPRALATSRT